MTLEEYLKKLADLQAQAQRASLHQLPQLERYAYDLMVELIDQNLTPEKGRLTPNDEALRFLNTFVDQYLGAFTSNQLYQGKIAGFLKNLKSVGQLMESFQKSRGLDPAKAQVGAAQEIVVNEIINRYTDNGLNAGFVQPLRELMFTNITGGSSLADAKAQLQDYILSGKDTTGKLGRYLEQTAIQAVDSYSGAINTRIMQTYKISTMIMSGSLIETSSPQCRYAINRLSGIIDRADWPAVEEIAKKNGLIKDTTFETLPFNRLHWGCRHEFTPVVLSQTERETITSNPTNE